MEEKKQSPTSNKKRTIKLYILLVIAFVITSFFYVFKLYNDQHTEQKTPVKESNGWKDSEGQQEIKSSELELDKQEKKNFQNIVSTFIKQYYSYDKKQPKAHLVASKSYLKNDFYQELVQIEDIDVKVPSFFYRQVTNVEFKHYEQIANDYIFFTTVDAVLLDEKKNEISKVVVDFQVTLSKVEGEWKVSYFIIQGKQVMENENN